MSEPGAHCSFCGAAMSQRQGHTRRCDACGETTYVNPIPVATVLLPVVRDGRPGLLAIRRRTPPRVGELSFPGGYVHFGESWQEGAVRELFEETGIELENPRSLSAFDVLSTSRGHLNNIYGLADLRDWNTLGELVPTAEASEFVLLDAPAPMAFPQDDVVVQAFFESAFWRGMNQAD